MRRSVSEKIVHYQPDGQGRDAFIKHCNGGFMSPDMKLKEMPSSKARGGTFWSSSRAKEWIKTESNCPRGVVNYWGDGSGRDYYVQFNNGGFYKTPASGTFMSSLRGGTVTHKGWRVFNSRLMNRQRASSSKLSQPRSRAQLCCICK
jgi:hypothetical protein